MRDDDSRRYYNSSPDEQYRHILIDFVERLFYRLNELNIDSNNIENWKNMALYGCILLAERPYVYCRRHTN